MTVPATDLDKRLELFHDLDFEGFNKQNWDLFGSLHTEDVVVELGGERTKGLDPHIVMVQKIFDDNPDTAVVEHLVKFGQGEWTCAISLVKNMGRPTLKLVTVARWRGDQISEEYIFAG
jgi:hypothetical protein